MPITKTIPLTTPVKIGDTEYSELTLREPTTADVIEAQEESEKVIYTPNGPALVASPVMVGKNILRRQVVSIGAFKGPVDLAILKRLSLADFNRVQDEADALDAAVAAAVLDAAGERGRDDGQNGGAQPNTPDSGQ